MMSIVLGDLEGNIQDKDKKNIFDKILCFVKKDTRHLLETKNGLILIEKVRHKEYLSHVSDSHVAYATDLLARLFD